MPASSNSTTRRTQLTLFVGSSAAGPIEAIRRSFNPEQYALIRAHVTLCREDELESIEQVLINLNRLDQEAISILFGPVIRFSEGKGVLLPALGTNAPFQQLRQVVLQGTVDIPRKHDAHITLLHPRNSTCTQEIWEQIRNFRLPETLTFSKISLIEQELGRPWQILQEFELKTYDAD